MKKSIAITLILLLLATGCLAQEACSPTRAMLYSAFIPGAGQICNRAWVKAGLVIGVQSWLIGSAIHHDHQKSHYDKLASSGQNPVQNLARRQDYQKLLNNDIWWIGITAVLSAVDAFVDAHLADFDAQKQELQLRFSDSAISLEFRF